MKTVLAALIALFVTDAVAQTVTSVKTPLDLDKCRHKESDVPEDYGDWRCKGHGGIAVYVTAGDQRTYMSFGRTPKKELAVKQTLAAFNGNGDAIEWRGETKAGKFRPYAAIVHFSVTLDRAGEKTEGEMIVIYRLPPGGSCQVGFVDAKANKDADDLARKIADEHARTFKCVPGTHPIFLGEKGPGFTGPYD